MSLLEPSAGQYENHGSVAAKLVDVNWLLIAIVGLIAAVGVAALYSAAGGSFQPWADRHVLRVLLGIAMVLAVAVVPLRFWLGLAYPAYAVALLLLVAVLVAGTDAMGARRWLGLGAITFQPSEIMKVALVLALARYYQWVPAKHLSWPHYVAVPLAMIATPVALVLRQPDLGTGVLFAGTGLSIMFLAGVSIWYFFAGAAVIAAIAPLAWSALHGYQRQRILTFLNPEEDPLGGGYHILQSKIALGSGGLGGKGYMQGTHSALDFVPEKHTDFIFTMFAEEMGFAGGLALIVLYGLLIAVLMAMALACRSQFARLLAAGAGLIVFVYVFINIAMVTGLVPVVGVPLPLVSYGGTSLVTIMLGLGLAMCAYVHRRQRIRPEDMGALW